MMPTRTAATGFWLRSRLLMMARALRGWRGDRARRWRSGDALATAPVCAQSRTPLWPHDPAEEFVLTAGKVHNLRLAAPAFHGVVVPAGARLSFWRQLGRPAASRGFVTGREVRAGCVIPAIAGGICQISNALATCAARAGFELVERHAHTARVDLPGDRLDATVFWNYVDLQIRAPVAWRIELELTADEMVMTLRAAVPRRGEDAALVEPAPAAASPRNCLTCDETTCFRRRPSVRGPAARDAWLLDDGSPEFSDWLVAHGGIADRLLPVKPRDLLRRLLRRRVGADGEQWRAPDAADGSTSEFFAWVSLRRAWWLRRHANHAGRRQASLIDGRRWLAAAYARRLRPEHVHLVIDQGLLPHLQQQGALGGRSYDVLAGSLPMDEIQRRLDLAGRASGKRIGNATLNDYRAQDALVQAEAVAMHGARRVLTAHTEVARHWKQRAPALDVRQLPWVMPASVDRRHPDALPLVVFPASSLARKGARELADALRGLSCRVRILGSVEVGSSVWSGVQVEQGTYDDDWVSRAAVVALPAHVEHAPRALLRAIAAGIPVIATPACGVSGMPGVHEVAAGDVAALRALLPGLLGRARKTATTVAANADASVASA